MNEAALRQLSDSPSSRKRFLKMVGAPGAAAGLALLVSACGGGDGGQGAIQDGPGDRAAKSDFEIVDYALTLEYLEADFYDKVIESKVVKGRALKTLIATLREHEHEHVEALLTTARTSGATPAEQPDTDFAAVLAGGERKVLETAALLENLGAAAYLGQVGKIERMEILAAAVSIHSVEARHASALNQVLGRSIVPEGAFAKPASMREVRAKIAPFLAN